MADVLEAMSLAQARYSRGAMWFHWIIALLIIVNLFIGYFHEDFGRAAGGSLMFWHKSSGILILFLSLGRLGWRLSHRPPTFDPAMPKWEVMSAKAGHWSFYALMIALPLSGWLMSSTGTRPIPFFGLFTVPALPVGHGHDAHELWEQSHTIIGYAMLALLAMHIAGALKHVFEGHGHYVGRMAPWLVRAR
jgi:cytochrome b561